MPDTTPAKPAGRSAAAGAKPAARKGAKKGAKAASPRRLRETKAARAARVAEILRRLAERYPAPRTALDHADAWQLLVATILSAQSTDETVNKVAPEVFRRWPTPADLAAAPREEIEKVIFPTGFFRNKARSIQGAAAAIVDRHGGEVPSSMEELVKLPGVGRKTANVVLGSFFERNEGVVVDTHVGRVASRLGLITTENPVKAELELMALLPKEDWTSFSHRLIWYGREVCKAKDPRCDACELVELCPSAFKVGKWAAPAPKKRAAAGKASSTRKGAARTSSTATKATATKSTAPKATGTRTGTAGPGSATAGTTKG
jgi:endonuclease III